MEGGRVVQFQSVPRMKQRTRSNERNKTKYMARLQVRERVLAIYFRKVAPETRNHTRDLNREGVPLR